MTQSEENLGSRIGRVLSLEPHGVALEFGDRSVRWHELEQGAQEIAQLLDRVGVLPGEPVGWAARNRPEAVAGFVALIVHGRMVVPLRPNYAVATFRDDISAQRLKAVIGDAEDWAGEGVIEAANLAGTVGIEISGPPFRARILPSASEVGEGPHREPAPGYVLERLTSGTTGAPKRLPVRDDVLIPSLRSGEQRSAESAPELAIKTSPALLFKPFSHAGGLFGLLLALYQARPIVLFERFKVDEWVAAVAKYKPKTASLVPAMIRMLLDEQVDPDKLASLIAVRCGTAALEPAVQDAFEERYGIPVLVDYGAAEFIGGLAGWTLKDHQEFGKSKRGSVGRPKNEVELRIVDVERGKPVPQGAEGLVEVRADRYGPDWVRTNDVALLDEDGFLFLRGRADDAINRGGFKILPDAVAAVLRRHPLVADAAVIGKPDVRLGQVPIAAIELSEGGEAPDPDALSQFLRGELPAYMIPVEYVMVERLPRTISMKVSRPELRALLGLEPVA